MAQSSVALCLERIVRLSQPVGLKSLSELDRDAIRRLCRTSANYEVLRLGLREYVDLNIAVWEHRELLDRLEKFTSCNNIFCHQTKLGEGRVLFGASFFRLQAKEYYLRRVCSVLGQMCAERQEVQKELVDLKKIPIFDVGGSDDGCSEMDALSRELEFGMPVHAALPRKRCRRRSAFYCESDE